MLHHSASVNLQDVEPSELARRARGGCADACTELFQRFRPRLLHLLKRRLGRHEADAEDVTQDALSRAFQHLGRYDDRYRFSTWLYTIAFRLARDHLRSRRRRTDTLALDFVQEPLAPADALPPIEQRERSENLWSIAEACLSAEQYTALWLRYGDDLAILEIARVMGRTQVGVRVLLHRARARLISKLSRSHRLGSTALRSKKTDPASGEMP